MVNGRAGVADAEWHVDAALARYGSQAACPTTRANADWDKPPVWAVAQSGKAEKNGDGAVQAGQFGGGQLADAFAEALLGNRGDLVHHEP